MNVIELSDLTKSFGSVTAVKNLSLSVPKGTIYGFIGPNGSGKTTTIRMIMKIMYPDSGEIHINGNKLESTRPENIGYLPEDRGLYKKMKVGELLLFHGELANAKNLQPRIDSWLQKLDLYDYKDKKVETLSKGMRQKLQFIATILSDPEIVILDEPFSGLDPVNAEILKDSILEMRNRGSTIIFSTHDMNMAEKMCDYIFMIYKGEKVLDDTLSNIQDKYGNDTIRLQADNGLTAIQKIKGIEKINNFGKQQEIRLAKDANPKKILTEILKITSLTKFELTTPSLNDIFIRIAAPEKKEDDHA